MGFVLSLMMMKIGLGLFSHDWLFIVFIGNWIHDFDESLACPNTCGGAYATAISCNWSSAQWISLQALLLLNQKCAQLLPMGPSQAKH